MKKQRRDKDYLFDMKKAVEEALNFTRGMSKENFEKNPMCESAVLYQLAVLGEAAKLVSKEFRMLHPDLPWKKMAGLRDVLIHAYHGVDSDIIWQIISEELPPLLGQLKRL